MSLLPLYRSHLPCVCLLSVLPPLLQLLKFSPSPPTPPSTITKHEEVYTPLLRLPDCPRDLHLRAQRSPAQESGFLSLSLSLSLLPGLLVTVDISPPVLGCHPDPCRNGGKCVVEKIHAEYVGPNGPAPIHTVYACVCPTDWTGERCETWNGLSPPFLPLFFSSSLTLPPFLVFT